MNFDRWNGRWDEDEVEVEVERSKGGYSEALTGRIQAGDIKHGRMSSYSIRKITIDKI